MQGPITYGHSRAADSTKQAVNGDLETTFIVSTVSLISVFTISCH